MTPTDGRSRTTSESKDTNSNGQAATANSTISGGHNIEDCFEVTMFDEGADGGRLPDVVAESKIYDVADENEPLESYLAITIQVFIPFLIAGLGMVGAGLVLDLVQVRTKFTYISHADYFSLLSPSSYPEIFYEARCHTHNNINIDFTQLMAINQMARDNIIIKRIIQLLQSLLISIVIFFLYFWNRLNTLNKTRMENI